MFLQYKGKKILILNNFERPDSNCNFQINLKLAELLGQESLFCFLQFTVMTLGSETLYHFSICMPVVIGMYRNLSLAKADYLVSWKLQWSPYSAEPLEFFAQRPRDSWEIMDKKSLFTAEFQYTGVWSSNGKKIHGKQEHEGSVCLLSAGFFSFFLSCWEGKKTS